MSYKMPHSVKQNVTTRIIIVISCLIAAITSSCSESQNIRYKKLIAAGEASFERREYVNALEAWLKAQKICPEDGGIYLNLGRTYLKLANMGKGIEAYRRAAELFPDNPEIKTELARLFLISGNLSSAEALISELIDHSADRAMLYILQGDMETLKGNLEIAEQSYRHGISFGSHVDLALAKLALNLLSQGDTETADKTYQDVAELSAKSIDTLIQMFHYQQLRENNDLAKSLLMAAIGLEPEDLSLKMELADFFIDTGNHNAACDILNSIMPSLPDSTDAQKLLVEIMMSQGRMTEAEELIHQLQANGTKDAEVEMLRGKYHLLSGEYTAAIGAFNSTLQIDPDIPMASYLLGVTFLANGQSHLARTNLTESLSLDPLFTDAELLLADLLYKEGEYELSAEHAKRIIDREPENYRAHQILGNIRASQGQYEDAFEHMTAAGKLAPESTSPLYHMAIICEKAGKRYEALDYYQRLLVMHPDLIDAISRYTCILLRLERISEAYQVATNAISRKPENAILYQILGEIQSAGKNYTEAIDAFNKAVELAPETPSAYLQLSKLYQILSDVPAQKDILSACIEKNPSSTKAYLKLAGIYRQENDFSSAIEILSAGLVHNVEDPWIMSNLAWIYLDYGKNINEAFSLAQSAYEQLPDQAPVGDTLGWAYYKKGHFRQAVWIMKDAVSIAPEDPLILYHLGIAQLAANDISEAEKNILKAIESGLDKQYQEDAEAALRLILEREKEVGKVEG